MSHPTVDRDPFEVVAESLLARFRARERSSIEDLVTRHPGRAEVIERDLNFPADPFAP
jgi:hypothetical protein